jgi:hypothetical protein
MMLSTSNIALDTSATPMVAKQKHSFSYKAANDNNTYTEHDCCYAVCKKGGKSENP